MKEIVSQLNIKSKELSIVELLKEIASLYPGQVVFTTSFGIEDQVITHLIFSTNIDIKVVTLETGRLFKETYKVYSKTLEKYNKPIIAYFPKTSDVEKMVSEKGPYSFYNSVEDRKECCTIRKVVPLNRALQNNVIWVTGIRAEQSTNRMDLQVFEFDTEREMIKYNPLLMWTFDEVKEFITKENIPYNLLHDKGFVSIGCEPCTRAIQPGEDFRAGRWWWEDNSKKECGLHTHNK
jgi:phosphoadenosine phosphosulfate reductase